MAPSRLISSLALAMTLTFIAPAQAFAPVHRLAPKKQVSLALSHPKAYARRLLLTKGLGRSAYNCLVDLVNLESHWNPKAKNPHSTAYGIGQLLIETSPDPAKQIRNMIRYLEYRYPSANPPCLALRFHFQHGYY